MLWQKFYRVTLQRFECTTFPDTLMEDYPTLSDRFNAETQILRDAHFEPITLKTQESQEGLLNIKKEKSAIFIAAKMGGLKIGK